MAIWNYWSQEKVRKVSLECVDHSSLEDAIRVRVIDSDKDSDELIANKQLYPFKTDKAINVYVVTNRRTMLLTIPEGYIWNGADIPKPLWCLVGGSKDNAFLLASMVHDYILEYKKETGFNNEDGPRITSLIFRQILIDTGINTTKANIMASAVHGYQFFLNRNAFVSCT